MAAVKSAASARLGIGWSHYCYRPGMPEKATQRFATENAWWAGSPAFADEAVPVSSNGYGRCSRVYVELADALKNVAARRS